MTKQLITKQLILGVLYHSDKYEVLEKKNVTANLFIVKPHGH